MSLLQPSMAQVEKITILRTPDPNLSGNRREWKIIARSEITLETDGLLDNEKLRVLGLGESGELPLMLSRSGFYICMTPLYISKIDIGDILFDTEYGPALIFCCSRDYRHALKRHIKGVPSHVKLMAHLKEVTARPWKYVTSRISRAVLHHSDLKLQHRLSQTRYLLTYWRQRRLGDYGYLGAINTIEEGKEYREAWLHQSQKVAQA